MRPPAQRLSVGKLSGIMGLSNSRKVRMQVVHAAWRAIGCISTSPRHPSQEEEDPDASHASAWQAIGCVSTNPRYPSQDEADPMLSGSRLAMRPTYMPAEAGGCTCKMLISDRCCTPSQRFQIKTARPGLHAPQGGLLVSTYTRLRRENPGLARRTYRVEEPACHFG